MIPVETGYKLKLSIKSTGTSVFLRVSWLQKLEDGKRVWSQRNIQTSSTQGETSQFNFNLISGSLELFSVIQTVVTAPETQHHIVAGIATDAEGTNEWALPITSVNCSFNKVGIWPNSRTENLVEDTGTYTIQGIADPIAGAEWSHTVGDNVAERIHTIEATLTASATAATRTPVLQVREGSNDIMRIPPSIDATANDVIRYTWSPDIHTRLTSGTDSNQPAPSFLLTEAMVLETDTANIQEGDQWSDIDIYLQRWPWGD